MASLIIDSREHDIIKYFTSISASYATVQQLSIGDIHIYLNQKLQYIIERKTISDLAASLKDGRYKEQKSRLSLSQLNSKHIIYIIEGHLNTTFPNFKFSGIPISTLETCILQLSLKYNFTVIQTNDVDNTCQILQKIIHKLDSFCVDNDQLQEQNTASILQNCNKKKSKEISFVSMLCQIPGISIKIGTKIAEQFESMSDLCRLLSQSEDNTNKLKSIIISSNNNRKRHLGPVLSKRIYEYLH